MLLAISHPAKPPVGSSGSHSGARGQGFAGRRALTGAPLPAVRRCAEKGFATGGSGGVAAILLVSSEQALANSSGVRLARLLCGRSALYSWRQLSIFLFASAR